MTISHLSAAALFALCASVIFGITLREKVRDQIRYGMICFGWFMGGLIVGAWVLFFLYRT